jgi:hypothetical protein
MEKVHQPGSSRVATRVYGQGGQDVCVRVQIVHPVRDSRVAHAGLEVLQTVMKLKVLPSSY